MLLFCPGHCALLPPPLSIFWCEGVVTFVDLICGNSHRCQYTSALFIRLNPCLEILIEQTLSHLGRLLQHSQQMPFVTLITFAASCILYASGLLHLNSQTGPLYLYRPLKLYLFPHFNSESRVLQKPALV